MKVKWKIRRRALVLGALVILVILVGIHYISDASVGPLNVAAGANVPGDDLSQAGLPSNHQAHVGPVVATAVLSATSILGHDDDIYLDGRLN